VSEGLWVYQEMTRGGISGCFNRMFAPTPAPEKRRPADIVFYYKKVRVIRYLTIKTPLARRIVPS